MATVVSTKGRLILPEQIREQLHLSPDDGFEVTMEDADTITLRRVSQPANCGLIDLLLACPAPFEIPPRERDDSRPPAL
jgi:AbrB family looped-hinge helix DNA binding protein